YVGESTGSRFCRELVRPAEGHVAGVAVSGNPSVQRAGSAGGRELEQHNPPSVSQDASHLLQGPVLILHMVERDDQRDPVEDPLRKWNLLCVPLLESNRRSKPSSLGDFLPVRLEYDHLSATRREPLRRRARATSAI